jgi:hypothetical protein
MTGTPGSPLITSTVPSAGLRSKEDGKGLPRFEQQMADTWRELEALANEPDEPTPERDGEVPR